MTGFRSLEHENERLRAALMPFGEAAAALRPDDADTMRPAAVQAVHYRRAADVLGLPNIPYRGNR